MTKKRPTIKPTRKGFLTKGNKSGRVALAIMALNNPNFSGVKRHSALVKRLSNEISKALQRQGINSDRGLVNQTALFHDVMKDIPNHDHISRLFFSYIGAEKIARTMAPGHTVRDYPVWPIERKIVHYADNLSVGIKSRDRFVNGIVPLDTAIRVYASKLKGSPEKLDLNVEAMMCMKVFESVLRKEGIDLQAIIRKQMKRNQNNFDALVKAAIDPNADEIIRASMKRVVESFSK